MRKIGQIDINFRNYDKGIFYYDVHVSIQGKTRTIILPRYDVFLGWIEVFGFPPQHEWVVLDDIGNIEKHAQLTIDSVEYEERMVLESGANSHTIQLIRSLGDNSEECIWSQDFSSPTNGLLNNTEFKHQKGEYDIDCVTFLDPDVQNFTSREQVFYDEIIRKYKKPDLVVRKQFSALGVLPEIYYLLFPIADVIDLSNVTGTVLELGYLQTDSQFRIDQVHGSWYKIFSINEQVFHIIETNYTSCDCQTETGIIRIKDTYRKELFEQ